MTTIIAKTVGTSRRALRDRRKASRSLRASRAAVAYPDTTNSSASRQPFSASMGSRENSLISLHCTCQPQGTKAMPTW